MPLDQYGRVIVNPRVPLGMPEFAALYAGEGATPMDAASNIHLNYPMEAKSFMDRSWKALGINQAPEHYFASAARRAVAAQPSAAMTPVDPTADRWPTFATEAERNIALAAGSYDPSYASPLQKSHAAALGVLEEKDRAAIRARADEASPIMAGMVASVANQLAGDSTGLVKRLLVKNSGLTMDQYMNQATGNPDSLLAGVIGRSVPTLKPYKTTGGFGPMEGTNLPSRLDMDLFSDPDFQTELGRNPEQAAYAYERLTGRKLQTDLGETIAMRKSQVDVGRKFATSAITQGAQKDPVTGKWKVWNMAEPEEGGIGLTPQRATRSLVEATPEQASWLDTHYESVMGRKAPQVQKQDAAYRQSIINTMEHDPQFQTDVDAKQAEIGRSLTNEELAMLAKLKLQRTQQQPRSWTSQAAINITEGLLRGATLPMNKEILGPFAIPTDQDIMNMLRALIPNLPEI